jgi:phosphatidylglycerol:prolipoprotein diacylglycerol transferase
MSKSFSALAYIIINIDPVFNIGPLAIHWYGVAYVVGISAGLWAILRYARRLGLHTDIVYSVFWWAALGGLIGGRLYFVIQQPDLVTNYLEKPINIIAVWNGGMAFFGAIFLGTATVAFVAWRRKLPIWLALDIATFFAAVGQIFGRFGNLVNGDIVGYPAGNYSVPPDVSACALPGSAPCLGSVSDPQVVPWATLYTNPHAFTQTSVPVHPAAAYEMLMNLILLALLWPLLLRLPRIKMGLVSLVYLAGYGLTQFIVFFWRGSEPTVPFLGIDTLKQAQWTAIFVLVAMIPYYFFIQRTSRAWTKEEADAANAAFQAQNRLPSASAAQQPEAAEVQAEPTRESDTLSADEVFQQDTSTTEQEQGGQSAALDSAIASAVAEAAPLESAENGAAPRPKLRRRTGNTAQRRTSRGEGSATKADPEA